MVVDTSQVVRWDFPTFPAVQKKDWCYYPNVLQTPGDQLGQEPATTHSRPFLLKDTFLQAWPGLIYLITDSATL